MLQKFIYNFAIASEAIFQNRLRSLLTSLGIIFGVGAVIAMVGIGRGAQEEILEKMKLLGADNIIIKPLIEQVEGDADEQEGDQAIQTKRFTPGLTMLDAEGLARLPFVKTISPEVELETMVVREGRKRSSKLVGVLPTYFEVGNFELAEGSLFSQQQIDQSAPVCIIGQRIKSRFFTTEEPLGKKIKCGRLWLTVVGVLKARNVASGLRDKLGIRNYDLDIYTPISTVLLRYENRALVTARDIQKAAEEDDDESSVKPIINYHQLDRLIIQVEDNHYSGRLSTVASRLLSRRHNAVVDFEIVVPELLLKQEQRARDLLNMVLFAIAFISLIVGGIGIMNIMLASVMERMKEIGLRLSVGATPRDITLQFMSEAMTISLTGGLIGIVLGISVCYIIEIFAEIPTVITGWSVVLSFVVAVAIGIIFGLYPAMKAAKQDPVVSLRHE